MTGYESLKLLHILGTALLLGTGMGSAFFLLAAYWSRDVGAIRVTASNVIVADWLFTVPAVVVQPVTGALLMRRLGLPFDSAWFVAVATLYVTAGCCWLPAVAIQRSLRDLARAAPTYEALPARFHRLMRWWIGLGVPAFTAVTAIVVLMVARARFA
jgi:uncharacterized membrane protein